MADRNLISQLRDMSGASLEAMLLRPYRNLFGEEVHERFAIVGNARTGSNYLLDGLKSSKSVKMYHEIFADHNREIGKDFDRVLSTLFQRESRGTRLVGFKLFYNHLTDDEWDRFLAHREFKLIHLTRQNRLRTIVSLEIAFKTGRWTSSRQPDHNQVQDRTILIEPAKLLARIEQLRQAERLARQRFSDRPVIEIVYEEMVREPLQTFEHVGDYLGIQDIDPTQIRIRRQNPEPLSQLLLNYAEMRQVLKDTEYAHYLDE
ncbi:MAG: Stf0 family sulfotransferase [Bacteroidota bacterium]